MPAPPWRNLRLRALLLARGRHQPLHGLTIGAWDEVAVAVHRHLDRGVAELLFTNVGSVDRLARL